MLTIVFVLVLSNRLFGFAYQVEIQSVEVCISVDDITSFIQIQVTKSLESWWEGNGVLYSSPISVIVRIDIKRSFSISYFIIIIIVIKVPYKEIEAFENFEKCWNLLEQEFQSNFMNKIDNFKIIHFFLQENCVQIVKASTSFIYYLFYAWDQ